MKKFALIMTALAFLAVGARAGVTGNINLLGVSKTMDVESWEPVHVQDGVGLSFDIRGESWPVGVVLGHQITGNKADTGSSDVELFTHETDLGMKFTWNEEGRVHPFLSGGLSSIKGVIKTSTSDRSDAAVGRWLSAGVYATLAGHVNLGLFYKVSAASVQIVTDEVNVGGRSMGVLVGYHF